MTYSPEAPVVDDALRRNEERLRLAQDAGGVACWEFDLVTGKVEWSPSGFRLFGVEPDWRPSYENFLARVHPEDRERVRATVEGVMRDGGSLDHQYRILTPDGEMRCIVTRARFFAGESGEKTRLVGVDIDVTSLKLTEQLLEEQRDQLERIEKLAGVGGLMVDLRERDRNSYSAGYKRLHGLSPEARNETRAEWTGRIHPEDRERVERQFDEALARGCDHIASEYRIVRPRDGEILWIEALAEIERDPAGNPLRLVGAHRDVTQRKELEQAMRESERRLRDVLDAMPQIVMLIRPDGSHAPLNRVWCEMTGLPEDAPQDSWRDAFHPEDAATIGESCARAWEEGIGFEVEARLRHRSGYYHWHLCRAVPVRGEDGRTRHWLGVCTDIHSLKSAQERARDSEARLHLALDAANAAGTWIWDIVEDRAVADVHTARLFGLDPVAASSGVPASVFFASVHPEDRERFDRVMDAALVRGGAFAVAYRVASDADGPRWIEERGRVELDAEGRAIRALGVSMDVTDQKRMHEACDLLTNELLHRIKNVFTLVSALSSLSALDAPDVVQEFARDFRARLQSLSAALLYLQPRPTSAEAEPGQTMMGLLGVLLEPFGLKEGRIVLEGGDASVDGVRATTSALLLHELATNAVKYGALSEAGGVVTVAVESDEEHILLTWRERGGPPIAAAPERSGFGSELITRLLSRQPGSRLDHAWEHAGLTATLRLRLDREL